MADSRLRVLLVGNDDDAYLTRNALALVTEPRYEIDHAACIEQAEGLGQDADYDVVMLDLELPGSTGVDTLARFRESCGPSVPIVVLSGLSDEVIALRALDEGAQDYIVKDTMRPELLSRTIRYAVQRNQLRRQLTTANALLEQRNNHLTRLCNTAQQFVDNVSHEFRSPLTVIREFTSIIHDGLDGPVTAQQVEHLEKVLQRTDDLALMVDDMLDVSRLEAGLLGIWRRPCRVADLIENVYELVETRAAAKRVNLTVRVAPRLPDVFCDEDKVQRVVINLAVNAIKFTPEGGQVCLWAHTADDPDEVVIGVADSGTGMRSQELEVIFQRFRQLNGSVRNGAKGFGLGLSIADELVRLNFGTMQVESEPGQGSTFSFTLPRNDSQVVVDRYVARLEASADATPHVALVVGRIDGQPKTNEETLLVADEFLNHSVRATDLVMRGSNRRWLIAASFSTGDAGALVERLHSEWIDFVRNCPDSPLPDIHFTVHGRWELPRQTAIFTTEFQKLAGETEWAPRQLPTVLVVDDDPEVSACLSVRLQAAGFHVIAAQDGEEGLALALAERPDAVVLDVCMPKKNGLEVLGELRQQACTADIPVVILSAQVSDRHQALEAGANYFIAKPYDAKSVLSAIESSIRKRGAHEHKIHSIDRR